MQDAVVVMCRAELVFFSPNIERGHHTPISPYWVAAGVAALSKLLQG